MLSEATVTDQGTYSYSMSFPQFAIRIPYLISFNILSPFLGYCIFSVIDTQPSESLSQVAAFNISRLLSKEPKLVRVFYSMLKNLYLRTGTLSV